VRFKEINRPINERVNIEIPKGGLKYKSNKPFVIVLAAEEAKNTKEAYQQTTT